MNGLALLRMNRDYRQEDVAKIMGLTRQAIANWETGKAKPDIDSVEKLAEIYDVPIQRVIEARKENVPESKADKSYRLSVNDNMPRFCTIRQAAKYILPERTLRNMQKNGILPGFYVGNRYYINTEMLVKMLNDRSRSDKPKETDEEKKET